METGRKYPVLRTTQQIRTRCGAWQDRRGDSARFDWQAGDFSQLAPHGATLRGGRWSPVWRCEDIGMRQG